MPKYLFWLNNQAGYVLLEFASRHCTATTYAVVTGFPWCNEQQSCTLVKIAHTSSHVPVQMQPSHVPTCALRSLDLFWPMGHCTLWWGGSQHLRLACFLCSVSSLLWGDLLCGWHCRAKLIQGWCLMKSLALQVLALTTGHMADPTGLWVAGSLKPKSLQNEIIRRHCCYFLNVDL